MRASRTRSSPRSCRPVGERPRRCPEPAPVTQVGRHQRVNTILPNTSPLGHRGEAVAGLGHRQRRGRSAAWCRWRRGSCTSWAELGAGAHRRADHRAAAGRRSGSARRRRGSGPLVVPLITTRAAGAQRPERVRPGGARRRSPSPRRPARAAARRTRTTSWAPISSARARLASSRLVASTCRPPARASVISAVATPPPAPCTSTVSPGLRPPCDEEHPVRREPGRRQAGGLLEATATPASARRCARGTATRSAKVPW